MSKRGAQATSMDALYRNRTLAWWRGQRLVTLCEITTNGGVSAPPGTAVEVVGKRMGLEVRTERCAHCGVRFTVSKVPPAWLALAEDPNEDKAHA